MGSVLLIVGAVEVVAGNARVIGPGVDQPAAAASTRIRLRIALAAALATGLLAGAAVAWAPRLHPMMTTTQRQPLRSAQLWVADNVPRDKVLVVHDSIWVDLVHRYRFEPRPIIVHKLDTDPAVRNAVNRLDYLVVPNWYYETSAGPQAYPTLIEARKHAVVVATFGSGDDGVRVYRVSRYWRP